MHNGVLKEKETNNITNTENMKISEVTLDPKERDFYVKALQTLLDEKIPFLVGGAYAYERYTGISRHTKDFDIFVKQEDVQKILDLFASRGYQSELIYPHWLGKVYCDGFFMDIIYNSGNGIARVDDEWFEHAVDDEVLGLDLKLCPPEEMLWSKSLIMERERYDGADVAHIFHCMADRLDWQRLLRRFGQNWRVLFSYIVLFGFIYPGKRTEIPGWVFQELCSRLQQESSQPASPEEAKLCQGTLLSREQYLTDVNSWGLRDGRLEPVSTMTKEDISHWTAAINQDH
ncbi:MAG TPA: hypothetical protein VH186_16755 [Chloroflexia bacterium]|nr:hypothetical protein [Chloroflexia bacterium]